MNRSTATYIEYDLRPAKQAERRMILDLLECMKEAGLAVSSYRYIGMGGIKFYDFAMVYRFLGIKDLISFERHKATAKRGEYNKPFGLIRVKNEPIGNYLKGDLASKETICWLDYDNALNSRIMDDISDLGLRLKVGGAAFVTVASEMPRDYLELSEEERLLELRSDFGDFAGDIKAEDVEEANFSTAWYKILHAAFDNAFSARQEGEFLPVFQVDYKDSLRMLTYGGAFLKKENKGPFIRSVRRRMPFLFGGKSGPYSIRTMNMTERERHLLEYCATARKNCRQANTLMGLGYKDSDLASYRELVRFMPRYVETLI